MYSINLDRNEARVYVQHNTCHGLCQVLQLGPYISENDHPFYPEVCSASIKSIVIMVELVIPKITLVKVMQNSRLPNIYKTEHLNDCISKSIQSCNLEFRIPSLY